MNNSYNKPPKTPEQQVEILRQRGMIINDIAAAASRLKFINYYRFSGYCLYFEENGTDTNRSHLFKENTKFEDVLQCYNFDSELRLLTIAAIETLEIGIRTQICLQMAIAHNDSHWYLRAAVFRSNYNHTQFLDLCNHETTKSKEEYINHYWQTYRSPHLPPSWVMIEILPMGMLSVIYKNLKYKEDRKNIADAFGVTVTVFESWLHNLNYLRNLCAHHQRLWNRQFAVNPKAVKNFNPNIVSAKTFAAQAVILEILLRVVNPEFNWQQKFNLLFKQYPLIKPIDLGFSEQVATSNKEELENA